jgi:hypothetical protein
VFDWIDSILHKKNENLLFIFRNALISIGSMPMTDSPGALRHPRAALALLSLSQLLIALDATIVFVALDAMGRRLQMDARHLQWVISAYSVAFGGCLLLGGRCAAWPPWSAASPRSPGSWCWAAQGRAWPPRCCFRPRCR